MLPNRGFDWLVQKHPRIFRVPASESEYRHAKARKPNVVLIQPVRKVACKRWPVQKREHAVAVEEVKVYECRCQI